MTLLRRFLVLQLLAVWQGGFFFYAAVVVPTGTDVLGATTQGSVTARVTDWLNAIAVVSLLLLAWEMRTSGSRPRWACWIVMSIAQIVLFAVHQRLEEMMDPDRLYVVEAGFYGVHRVYLIASTVQWAAALAFVWLTLRAWRRIDQS